MNPPGETPPRTEWSPLRHPPRLRALNIDPGAAAEAYRVRVLAGRPAEPSATDRDRGREQRSGARAMEIAAFDESASAMSASTA